MPISLLRFVISEYLLSFRKISQGICSHQILQPKGSEAILASPMLEEYMPLPRCVFIFVWMWGVFIHTTYKTKHHVHFTPGTLGPVLPSLKKCQLPGVLRTHNWLPGGLLIIQHSTGKELTSSRAGAAQLSCKQRWATEKTMAPLKRHARNSGISKVCQA